MTDYSSTYDFNVPQRLSIHLTNNDAEQLVDLCVRAVAHFASADTEIDSVHMFEIDGKKFRCFVIGKTATSVTTTMITGNVSYIDFKLKIAKGEVRGKEPSEAFSYDKRLDHDDEDGATVYIERNMAYARRNGNCKHVTDLSETLTGALNGTAVRADSDGTASIPVMPSGAGSDIGIPMAGAAASAMGLPVVSGNQVPPADDWAGDW